MNFENYIDLSDSIIACSTGEFGNSAISVVRISGPMEPDSLALVFPKLGPIEPKRCYLAEIIENNKVLDEVILTFFKGPNSYTGENVYEISAHGNQLNIKRIINFLSDKLNLRRSGPGEFTYRALKNKKFSLSQVEGLDQLLNARSIYSLDSGMDLLKGGLQAEFLKLRDQFLNVKSAIELNTDFSEDIGDKEGQLLLDSKLSLLMEHINLLHKRGSIEPDLLLSPTVGLFGAPNSGKSTLFNQLLKRDRSIVSDKEGTTRDFISEKIIINQSEFELIDTAGLRESDDLIEMEGVKRALNIRSNCFYKILLINSKNKTFSFKESEAYDLIIFTHTDVAISELNINGSIGANLLKDDLSKFIFDLIANKFKKIIDINPFTVPRHRDLVNKLYLAICDFNDLRVKISDIAILSSELSSIENLVNELVGQVSTEEVLKNIFSNFCIGK